MSDDDANANQPDAPDPQLQPDGGPPGGEAPSSPSPEPAPEKPAGSSKIGSTTGMHFIPPTPEELDAVLDQYEFLEIIGKGGMGAVYKARQKNLNRIVAIKVLPAHLQVDDDGMNFAKRFKQEARAMAQLSHPNILQVYDVGETTDGQLYIVMEFVEGTDLHQLIRGKQLTVEHFYGWIPPICDALFYAHSQGIIHRDIKPSNIMINSAGQVKIADFGLAKLIGGDHALTTKLTMTNVAMGTPDYVAPEQLIEGAEVDHRADLYSLGILLYEMLTGSVPRGRTRRPSTKNPALDKRLDDVVFKAIDESPDDRYQSAGEISSAITTIRTTPPPSDVPAGGTGPVMVKRKPKLVTGSVQENAGRTVPGSDPASPLAGRPPRGATAPVRPGARKSGPGAGLWIGLVSGLVLLGIVVGVVVNRGGDGDRGSESGGDTKGPEISKVDPPDPKPEPPKTAPSIPKPDPGASKGESEILDSLIGKAFRYQSSTRVQTFTFETKDKVRVTEAGAEPAEWKIAGIDPEKRSFTLAKLGNEAFKRSYTLNEDGTELLSEGNVTLSLVANVATPEKNLGSVAGADGWVDLLSMVELEKHVIEGKFERTPDGAVVDTSNENCHLAIPAADLGDVEIEIDVTRLDGTRGWNVTIPDGENVISMNFAPNLMRVRGGRAKGFPEIPPNEPCKVRLSINRNSEGLLNLKAVVNDEHEYTWPGDAGGNFDTTFGPSEHVCVGIADQTTYRIDAIRIRGDQVPKPEPAEASPDTNEGWIDVLSMVDLGADVVGPRSSIEQDSDGSIRAIGRQSQVGISLPRPGVDHYQIRADFTQMATNSDGEFRAGLFLFPAADSGSFIAFGGKTAGYFSTKSGPEKFSYSPPFEVEQTRRVLFEYESRGERQARLAFFVDGNEVARWSGDPATLLLDNRPEVPTRFGFGFVDRVTAKFSMIQVRSLTDQPLAFAPKPPPPRTEVDRRLSEVEAQFRERYLTEVLAGHSNRVESLNQQYLGALSRAEDAASAAANLDEVLAIQAETKRVENGDALPETDDPQKAPASVIGLRKTYRTQIGKLEQTREAAVKELAVEYGKALDQVQRAFTKEAKIEEALKVKAVRDAVKNGDRGWLGNESGSVGMEPQKSAEGAKAFEPPLPKNKEELAEWLVGTNWLIDGSNNNNGHGVFRSTTEFEIVFQGGGVARYSASATGPNEFQLDGISIALSESFLTRKDHDKSPDTSRPWGEWTYLSRDPHFRLFVPEKPDQRRRWLSNLEFASPDSKTPLKFAEGGAKVNWNGRDLEFLFGTVSAGRGSALLEASVDGKALKLVLHEHGRWMHAEGEAVAELWQGRDANRIPCEIWIRKDIHEATQRELARRKKPTTKEDLEQFLIGTRWARVNTNQAEFQFSECEFMPEGTVAHFTRENSEEKAVPWEVLDPKTAEFGRFRYRFAETFDDFDAVTPDGKETAIGVLLNFVAEE